MCYCGLNLLADLCSLQCVCHSQSGHAQNRGHTSETQMPSLLPLYCCIFPQVPAQALLSHGWSHLRVCLKPTVEVILLPIDQSLWSTSFVKPLLSVS